MKTETVSRSSTTTTTSFATWRNNYSPDDLETTIWNNNGEHGVTTRWKINVADTREAKADRITFFPGLRRHRRLITEIHGHDDEDSALAAIAG